MPAPPRAGACRCSTTGRRRPRRRRWRRERCAAWEASRDARTTAGNAASVAAARACRRYTRPMPLRSVDVVCRVVDHLGDAGFCWRLARQLAAEHALSVRLWIDDVATLARISPVDSAQESQRVDGVVVRRLRETVVPDALPEVVVAAFGCALPDAWLDAYVAAPVPPLWIHLEYLTAEAWIDDAHGLPSPPPRRPALRRWFFFPGFTDTSGGLLRERGLLDARDAYRCRADAREAAWRDAGLAPPVPGELAVSLFCYPNPALPALLDAWAAGP